LDNTIEELTEEKDGVLIFNTNLLLTKLELWVNEYIERIEKVETYNEIHNYIKKIVDEDLNAITRRSEGNKFPCRTN